MKSLLFDVSAISQVVIIVCVGVCAGARACLCVHVYVLCVYACCGMYVERGFVKLVLAFHLYVGPGAQTQLSGFKCFYCWSHLPRRLLSQI